MSNRVNKRISYRDEILAAVREIVNSKGINQFEVGEVVEYMLSKNQNLNPSTIRTHITSRCCVNAPANHPVTYNDYERIKRGVYRLYEPLSSVKDEGRVLTKDKLFFVDINDSNNRLLALDLEIRCEDDGRTRVSFYDTNRGRGFYGEIEYQDPQTTVFRTEQGDKMTFRVATLEEYNKEWRRYIEGSVPDFLTDEELHKWYYKQFLG